MVGTQKHKLLVLSTTPLKFKQPFLGRGARVLFVGNREPCKVLEGGHVEVTGSRLACGKDILVAVVQN